MTTLELSPDTELLTPADIEPAAQVIAQAFTDDPLCTFMLPSSKSRLSALLKFFRLYGELNIKNQRGFGAGEPLQGVAYWKTPSQAELSVSVRSLAGFLPLLFSAYPRGYLRAKMILQQIDALHEQYACEPHYYLDNIGVSSAQPRSRACLQADPPISCLGGCGAGHRLHRYGHTCQCRTVRAFRLSMCGRTPRSRYRHHGLGAAQTSFLKEM